VPRVRPTEPAAPIKPKPKPKPPVNEPIEVILARFYNGEPLTCRRCGSTTETVRVGTRADGGGELWTECMSCAQRDHYEIPKATPEEKIKAMDAQDFAPEGVCPRHRIRVTLRRRGRQFVCPDCGVVYRDLGNATD
jgi:predicted RNA-binding Zn-ribbon protein involved in translation (DUF1610 family)